MYHKTVEKARTKARFYTFFNKKNRRDRDGSEAGAVSRVLSCTAIYLSAALPRRFSPPAELCRADTGIFPSAYGVASDRVYICTQSPVVPVSSYLAFPSLPSVRTAVYFCCTFPGVASGGRYPLSLPCEARTFLTPIPFGNMVRGSPLLSVEYYIGHFNFCQGRTCLYGS